MEFTITHLHVRSGWWLYTRTWEKCWILSTLKSKQTNSVFCVLQFNHYWHCNSKWKLMKMLEIGGFYFFSAFVSTTCQWGENDLFLMAATYCRTALMHFILLSVIWNIFILLKKNKVILHTQIQISIKHALCTLLKTLTTLFLEAVTLLWRN